MKIGIVSDTHSNLYALQSVLKHMDSVGVDKKVHCGDIVGYGPNPNETLELTLESFNYIVMGNHDLAVTDPKISEYFNPQAKKAVSWTMSRLSNEELDILSNLRYGHKINDMLFIHGSPQANNPHGYLVYQSDAKSAFSDPVVDFRIAFVGHTHQPFVWREDSFERITNSNSRYELGMNTVKIEGRTIVNVGSVGQPRDNDPRASYAIYDTEKEEVYIYKVPYPIEKTIGHMQRLGFDSNAYERLIYGR